ncbi:MAG: GNAT family N-acetyltransferase [Anaerolineae bacterium]|nr:GNAT family N-acetyltransferase [Anaerolineae bacterium]
MEIRVAKIADVQTIADLNVEVQNLHAAALPHMFKAVSDGAFAVAFITEQIKTPANYFLIANVDGEDVGYVFARLVRRTGNEYMRPWSLVYIDQIAVKASHQRRGCGSALIQAVRDLADEFAIETIALDTWAFNEAAQAFFAKQGFTTYKMQMWAQVEA